MRVIENAKLRQPPVRHLGLDRVDQSSPPDTRPLDIRKKDCLFVHCGGSDPLPKAKAEASLGRRLAESKPNPRPAAPASCRLVSNSKCALRSDHCSAKCLDVLSNFKKLEKHPGSSILRNGTPDSGDAHTAWNHLEALTWAQT
eukprot:695710-Prymnesium_polylepis.1